MPDSENPPQCVTYLPYGRQAVDAEDIAAVVEVLRSDWLTTGPRIEAFEHEFARRVGVRHAVSVSSGTAALHAAMFAAGITSGDEVLVPAITFAATANCVVYQGGVPRFVDVNPETLLIDLEDLKQKITPQTRAIIAVDYAGQPCNYDDLRQIARLNGLVLIADACHSLGGSFRGRNVGTLADLNAFSFHPVKHITTGEGGMVTTDNEQYAQRIRQFRNHGILSDHHQRSASGNWSYDMTDLGYNYRLSDIQAALGRSQLRKLPDWITSRRRIADQYNRAFSEVETITPLRREPNREHAYHLYVIRAPNMEIREFLFHKLRDSKIGVNVHYRPVYLHPYYRERFGIKPGCCPNAEAAYNCILSLPMFPAMTERDVDYVARTVARLLQEVTAELLSS